MKVVQQEIQRVGRVKLDIPRLAECLSVQMQGDKIQSWWLVNERNAVEQVTILIYGTGDSMSDSLVSYLEFLGTVQDGPFVWHVFQEISP